jgi:hypothetical protein
MIDYDNEGEVDFKKFCLINTDKSNDVKKLIEQMKSQIQQNAEEAKQAILDEKQSYLINMGHT